MAWGFRGLKGLTAAVQEVGHLCGVLREEEPGVSLDDGRQGAARTLFPSGLADENKIMHYLGVKFPLAEHEVE